jgi:hypothetical protein
MRSIKPGSGDSIKIPGVGTFVAGRDTFQRPVDKYFDQSGKPMEEKQFLERAKGVLERKKYGGLVYSNSSTPTLPVEKYASYNNPASGGMTMIQPVIIPQPVATSGESSGIIAFAIPRVNSSSTTDKLVRS